MASKSILKTKKLLVWETEKPPLDLWNESPIFTLMSSKWLLRLCYYVDDRSLKRFCSLFLVNCDDGFSEFQPLTVKTYLVDTRNEDRIAYKTKKSISFERSGNFRLWKMLDSNVPEILPDYGKYGDFTIVCDFYTTTGCDVPIKIEKDLVEYLTKFKNEIRKKIKLPSSSRLDQLNKDQEISEHKSTPDIQHTQQTETSKSTEACTPKLHNLFLDNGATYSRQTPSSDILNSPRNYESLSEDFGNLLDKSIMTDAHLKSEERTIPVHKAILAARSEVFAAMFRNEMAESSSGVIDIKDINTPVLEGFLKYLYSGKIPDDLPEDMVPKLYTVGDKYAVHALTKVCSNFMAKDLTEDNYLSFLTLADAHSDKELKDAVADFVAGHGELLTKETWISFSEGHPKLANEIYQKYVTRSLYK